MEERINLIKETLNEINKIQASDYHVYKPLSEKIWIIIRELRALEAEEPDSNRKQNFKSGHYALSDTMEHEVHAVEYYEKETFKGKDRKKIKLKEVLNKALYKVNFDIPYIIKQ